MRVYNHLTLSEREYPEEKMKEGKSLRWIAGALGRSPSTLSREVKRNWSKKSDTRYFDSSIHDRKEIGDRRGRLGCLSPIEYIPKVLHLA